MTTDATNVFPPGFRVTDNATGAPLSGGKIRFYNAGTSTPKPVYSDAALSSSLGSTVYCDSMGTPVASQGSSTAVMIYVGTAAYKVTITDANDTTIRTLDNIKGALDTSTFLTTGSTSTLTQPVITKTGNYTVVAADRSKLIECNTTGGQFTLTLTAAATLGDNWSVKIRNSGTANQFILAASQNIAFEGQTFTARAFQIGEGAEIICDGTGFKLVGHTPPLMSSRDPGIIRITDRVTSDPSATAGARYIVATGYGSYATGDIIEANGSTFNKYTPPTDCGWLAYVQDENAYYSFQDSAWTQVFPSASDTVAGLIELADQSEMEAGSDTGRAVTPGRQHFHPKHPKAWVTFNGTGTLAVIASSGVSSVTDNGTGNYTANWATAFSASTAYGIKGWARSSNASNPRAGFISSLSGDTKSTSAFQVRVCFADSATPDDSPEVSMVAVGDL
jgi:hypothetical protein